MIDIREYQKKQSAEGMQTPYTVQLLSEKPLELGQDELLAELQRNCGDVEALQPESGLLIFAHNAHRSQFQEGMVPAQSLITTSEQIENPSQSFVWSLNQTWDWPESTEAVSKCRAMISVTDLFADRLHRRVRLEIFHCALKSILKLTSALAIHWLPSQRIVNRDLYLKDLGEGGFLFSGAVNVRMFKVEDSNERIMDTMGLRAFGLPDLQCHFQDLNPADVGSMLYNYADYIFQKGDVINDGDNIQSYDGSGNWRCQHEMAMIEPSRIVVDIHPGQHSPPREPSPPEFKQ
jgi:hypothetical protein